MRIPSAVAMAVIALLCACVPPPAIVETGITNLTQVTNEEGLEFDPSVGPDGRVYFGSDRAGFLEIWAMPISGGGIQQVTTSAVLSADTGPDVSPDGNSLVLISNRVAGHWNIWKMSLGTRGMTQLTNGRNDSIEPAWSPDGQRIAFVQYDKDVHPYVWIMDEDGRNTVQLAPGRSPDWAPDGERIVYARETKAGNFDIWTMSKDGTNAIQITSEPEKQEFWLISATSHPKSG
jgi:TolB protein